MAKRKYQYEGRDVDGEPVEWTTLGENWTTYELADGSTIKTKIVMLDVARLDEFNENGDPIYLFNAQQVLGVTPNPQLKKKVN
jgi:hypothetical protein